MTTSDSAKPLATSPRPSFACWEMLTALAGFVSVVTPDTLPWASASLVSASVPASATGGGVRAAQELGVQQAARLEIGDVLHLAGHLFRSVRPRDGEPDALDVTRGLHRRRHGLKPSGRARRPRLR